MTNLSHGDLEADAKDYAIGVLIEELRDGVTPLGIHDDNSTELFDVEGANEKMLEAADALAAAHATIHQLGENAVKAAGEYAEEVGRLREALKPFAFLDMGRDEDEGVPFTTQEVWQTIYRDRVQDWISFEELDAARAALTEPTDG